MLFQSYGITALVLALGGTAVAVPASQDGGRDYTASTSCASSLGCGPDADYNTDYVGKVASAITSSPPDSVQDGQRYGCVSAQSGQGQFCAIMTDTHDRMDPDYLRGFLDTLHSFCPTACGHASVQPDASAWESLTEQAGSVDVAYFAN